MITEEDLKLILSEDHEDYEPETSEEILFQSRWSTHFSQVFHRVSDHTYWELSWSRGSTEYQDEGAENIEFSEVVPQEYTAVRWVAA